MHKTIEELHQEHEIGIEKLHQEHKIDIEKLQEQHLDENKKHTTLLERIEQSNQLMLSSQEEEAGRDEDDDKQERMCNTATKEQDDNDDDDEPGAGGGELKMFTDAPSNHDLDHGDRSQSNLMLSCQEEVVVDDEDDDDKHERMHNNTPKEQDDDDDDDDEAGVDRDELIVFTDGPSNGDLDHAGRSQLQAWVKQYRSNVSEIRLTAKTASLHIWLKTKLGYNPSCKWKW